MPVHPDLRAAIFDIDGVLVDSPHERLWRETLDRLMAGPWQDLAAGIHYRPGALTTERYQRAVAGRPRLDGARAALEEVGAKDPSDHRVREYAEAKQAALVEAIHRDPPPAFADAITFLVGVRDAGLAVATASASKNADALLAAVTLPDGTPLRDVLDADVSGLDGPGKPDPAIFLEAARRLAQPPARCVVIEDAPNGAAAARRGGMACVGVDRTGDADELRAEGADLVLDRLDRLPAREILAWLGEHD
jgi:HAD superfamily hydrolase (TIGR01509 family)